MRWGGDRLTGPRFSSDTNACYDREVERKMLETLANISNWSSSTYGGSKSRAVGLMTASTHRGNQNVSAETFVECAFAVWSPPRAQGGLKVKRKHFTIGRAHV